MHMLIANPFGVSFVYLLLFLTEPCITENDGCQHICVVQGEGSQCACRVGYRLQPDHKTCLSGTTVLPLIGNKSLCC